MHEELIQRPLDTAYAAMLAELTHCEALEAKWGKAAADARADIVRHCGRPVGSRAQVMRANGARINVTVCAAIYRAPGAHGPGTIKYRFRWPYAESSRFRECVIADGDQIVWAPGAKEMP
jgi:hypothetical protein